jgi:hypothetical protein
LPQAQVGPVQGAQVQVFLTMFMVLSCGVTLTLMRRGRVYRRRLLHD